MLEKKHLAMAIMKFDSLPENAYLIPMLHHNMGKIDDLYNPKKIIFNFESLVRCERSYLEKMIKVIYDYNLGKKRDEQQTF